MLVKPHYFVLCVRAIVLLMLDVCSGAERRRLGLVLFARLLLPLLMFFGYLGGTGSLRAFLDLAINYWAALYGHVGRVRTDRRN